VYIVDITLDVAILLQRFKIDNPWITEKWQAIGVIPTKKNMKIHLLQDVQATNIPTIC
jgi:hypothetical protein